jgi:glycosyltransferase involved in cell wall biosynthesis
MKIAIVIFAYNRPSYLRKMMNSLFQCKGIDRFSIVGFIDGEKRLADKNKIHECSTIFEDYSVSPIVREQNIGLKSNIIRGLSAVSHEFDAFIVLEDDLVLHPDFLEYHEFFLQNLVSNKKVFSVSGFGPKLDSITSDYYFNMRFSSWGWSTWSESWQTINWEPRYSRICLAHRLKFSLGVGSDVDSMLRSSLSGKISSWAIIATYNAFVNGLYSVSPKRSLVKNIGIGKDATHTKSDLGYLTDALPYDESVNLTVENIQLSEKIWKDHKRLFSLVVRVKRKLGLLRSV